MRVALIGANGQLGGELQGELRKDKYEVASLTHQDIEIVHLNQARSVLAKHQPDYVINTAAFHDVGKCELLSQKAFAVNAVGVRNLAQICAEFHIPLVHVSTDYVFDGRKNTPYTESDLACPLNVYGLSKLAGEFLIRATLEKYFIVRTAGLYGRFLCRAKKTGNFVDLMLKLAQKGEEIRVVNDVFSSPTYTKDLAHQVVQLMGTEHYGLYHVVNGGGCSWFEFAEAIFNLTGKKANLVPISAETIAQDFKRPAYSVLANDRLQQLGMDYMPSCPYALAAYLEEKGVI